MYRGTGQDRTMRFKAINLVPPVGSYLVAMLDLPVVVEVAPFRYAVRSRTRARQ